MALNPWDVALVAAVSVQATVAAYLYQPRWKALVFMLPIPFTFGTLAVGRPVDATSAAGLILLLAFMLAVRFLHVRLRVPIVASIGACAVAYCLLGGALRPVMPTGTLGFWATLAGVAMVGIVANRLMPPRDEPGQRTGLPVWLKLPIMAAVIVGLIVIKSLLGGFLAMFPMMGMTTAYEARRSLWTLCRQVPILMMMFVPMMSVVYLVQQFWPLPAALAVGWAAYLAVFLPYWWRRDGET